MKKLRSKSLYVIPFVLFSFVFMGTYGCTPRQVETAKTVFSKVSFYSNLARALITVAETHYKDNVKVAKALVAAKVSLSTLEALVAAISAGLDYNENELVVGLARLISDVFSLMEAIKGAKSVS